MPSKILTHLVAFMVNDKPDEPERTYMIQTIMTLLFLPPIVNFPCIYFVAAYFCLTRSQHD